MLSASIRRSGHSVKSTSSDELRPFISETMENFQEETKKALWHVYNMLDSLSTGAVHVSQLKVITSSVGLKMGKVKAETILDDNTELSMDFNTYFDIVKSELIDKQDFTDVTCIGPRLTDIIKTCWALCNFERNHKSRSFTTDHCMVLWRLFNFLSDIDDVGQPEVPVCLDIEEAVMLIRDFIEVTGQRNKESRLLKFSEEYKGTRFLFKDFLNTFEKEYVTGLSTKAVTQGLHQLYDKYVLNILNKGKIWKRGFKVKSWKERWMVLTPTGLNYYVGSDEKIMKGSIVFDKDCTLEVPPDRPTHRPYRFVLNTPKKPYEMSAPDVKTKNEWVSGIQLALSRVGKDPNIQREETRKRCYARAEKRRREADEERKRKEEAALLLQRQNELDEAHKKRLEDEELLRARLNELEEERKRREEAEAKWQEEEALRKAEQERLRQLEEIKRELERLLAEEREAKRDEEIVRNLQAKLLEEEFERREELERLKQQQEEMLKAEREQKAVLESDKIAQARLLTEAQARLDQLETERQAAATKMEEATDKLQKAEKDRSILEEKVKLWKTPVGLARPLQPRVVSGITHRGLGAFCNDDFVKGASGLEIQRKSRETPGGEKSDIPNNSLKVGDPNPPNKEIETNKEHLNPGMVGSHEVSSIQEKEKESSETLNQTGYKESIQTVEIMFTDEDGVTKSTNDGNSKTEDDVIDVADNDIGNKSANDVKESDVLDGGAGDAQNSVENNVTNVNLDEDKKVTEDYSMKVTEDDNIKTNEDDAQTKEQSESDDKNNIEDFVSQNELPVPASDQTCDGNNDKLTPAHIDEDSATEGSSHSDNDNVIEDLKLDDDKGSVSTKDCNNILHKNAIDTDLDSNENVDLNCKNNAGVEMPGGEAAT